MYKLQELTPPTDDPDAKALACYGLLVRPGPHQLDQMWLRFVSGRPVSAVTLDFLAPAGTAILSNGKNLPEQTGSTDRWDQEYVRREGEHVYVTVRSKAVLEFRW